MSEVTQKFVNITQAASLLGVHAATVRRWMDEEKIKYEQISLKKYLIPIGEVFRLQAEKGIRLTMNVDGTVEYRHLHPEQQVDFIANKIDYLELVIERKRLMEEMDKAKQHLQMVTQAIERNEHEIGEQMRVFQWPNHYLDLQINNSPALESIHRYRFLKDMQLIE